eukprot:9870583-Alexandrium_andersonii.AAC.1
MCIRDSYKFACPRCGTRFRPYAPGTADRLTCNKIWVVRASDEMAQTISEDELCDGQAIVAPVVRVDSATSRLQNRLKEISLGIRRAIADLPPERQLGAVVSEVRRFGNVPA